MDLLWHSLADKLSNYSPEDQAKPGNLILMMHETFHHDLRISICNEFKERTMGLIKFVFDLIGGLIGLILGIIGGVIGLVVGILGCVGGLLLTIFLLILLPIGLIALIF